MIATLLAATLLLQTRAEPKEVVSVRKFVQDFYTWYTPKALGTGNSELEALNKKASLFAPDLRRALLDDWKASSENSEEIVGLDFDPFLNSQDPYTRYVVDSVKHKGKVWNVDVHGVINGKRNTSPDVTAMVEKSKGKWRFTNFLYGQGSNLVKILKELKKDREKG